MTVIFIIEKNDNYLINSLAYKMPESTDIHIFLKPKFTYLKVLLPKYFFFPWHEYCNWVNKYFLLYQKIFSRSSSIPNCLHVVNISCYFGPQGPGSFNNTPQADKDSMGEIASICYNYTELGMCFTSTLCC